MTKPYCDCHKADSKFDGNCHYSEVFDECEHCVKDEVYEVKYAWTSALRGFNDKPTEDRIFCAWCKKSKAEIRKTEDPNEHVEEHDKNGE